MLEKVGQEWFIFTLDMTKGYWQIPMAATNHEKTALCMSWGLFEFQHMFFSLHGMGAMFQRLMDHLLAPHQAFIDDMIVFSETWGQHLEALLGVLQELHRAGLTTNPAKRRMAQYLGFQVEQGQIHPLEDKVRALSSYERP